MTNVAEREAIAERLGVSNEAVEIAQDAEVIDLHLDTFIPVRLVDYDLHKNHENNFMRGVAFGHLDLPRARDAGLKGGMWSITTNPFRTAGGRWRTFQKNLERMRSLVAASNGALEIVKDRAAYDAARARGAHAVMVSVQGGNCFDAAPNSIGSVEDGAIVRVTVVHLTNSALGAASTPLAVLRKNRGLTEKGRALIEVLNMHRVFVDLAHIHPDGFWDAVDVHDKTQPLIDTHTGVDGVREHWRNLDDRQLRAIAETGGTVGIIYAKAFLQTKGGPKDGAMIVDHMQHVIDVIGEDHISVGSDYDGAIIPPRGFESGDSYPKLVQLMLDRRWTPNRILKVLGGNFLRAFGQLRPGA